MVAGKRDKTTSPEIAVPVVDLHQITLMVIVLHQIAQMECVLNRITETENVLRQQAFVVTDELQMPTGRN